MVAKKVMGALYSTGKKYRQVYFCEYSKGLYHIHETVKLLVDVKCDKNIDEEEDILFVAVERHMRTGNERAIAIGFKSGDVYALTTENQEQIKEYCSEFLHFYKYGKKHKYMNIESINFVNFNSSEGK